LGNWNAVYSEIAEAQLKRQRVSPHDEVRRKYLDDLHKLTGRNVVAYYSGWLQKPGPDFNPYTSITDDDKNGFMSAFAGLDFSKGLDLILHTPGGDVAATESIIDYLRAKFNHDIRTIVPQISMSAGTVIACVGREIVMGTHSNLGPIDPQFGSMPAIALLEEFERAKREVSTDPKVALVWQHILNKYDPTLLSHADNAIRWTKEIAIRVLCGGMLRAQSDPAAQAEKIAAFLGSRNLHHAHGRHLHRQELRECGLTITNLENDSNLQNAVLSVHHAFMQTLNTDAVKIIENHCGSAWVKAIRMQAGPPQHHQVSPPVAPPPPPPNRSNVADAPAVVKIPLMVRLRLAIRLIFRGQ